MITVKFFGLLSVNYNLKNLSLNEGTVNQALDDIIRLYPSIEKKQLLQSILAINNVVVMGRKRLSISLKENDVLVFLSPSSGG